MLAKQSNVDQEAEHKWHYKQNNTLSVIKDYNFSLIQSEINQIGNFVES